MGRSGAQAKVEGRLRRKVRTRKKVFGTTERPRLGVFRSARHIYAQVIDDEHGVTLVSASTLKRRSDESITEGKKVEKAKGIGLAVAEACKGKQIEKVVFDRNGYKYHGRVRAVADGAREGGLSL